jgi:hypothetical protein
MLLEKLPRACRLRGSGVGERPPLSRGLALSMGLVVALAAKRDVFRRLFGLLNGGLGKRSDDVAVCVEALEALQFERKTYVKLFFFIIRSGQKCVQAKEGYCAQDSLNRRDNGKPLTSGAGIAVDIASIQRKRDVCQRHESFEE